MRRPANHRRGRRDRARQCLAPTNNHLKLIGARQCIAPTNNHLKFVEGDACVALRPPPWASKQGEAMPRPYEQSPKIRRGDACVALQTTATYVERGRGNASPLRTITSNS